MGVRLNMENDRDVFSTNSSHHDLTSSLLNLNDPMMPSILKHDETLDIYLETTRTDDEDDFFGLDFDNLFNENISNEVTNVELQKSNAKRMPDKKTIFDTDREDEDVDLAAWTNKPKEEWNEIDVSTWLIWASGRLGLHYGKISPNLAISGRELLRLSRQDFVSRDKLFGDKLYDLFHTKVDPNPEDSLFQFGELEIPSDDESSAGEEESFPEEPVKSEPGTRRRGRPSHSGKQKKTSRLKLPDFIKSLLFDPNYCPDWIRWEDYDEKVFRFIKPHDVARLWGELQNKKHAKPMDFEKFTRAMRYYYTKGILTAVYGRRLVYKFGDKATGLETDHPNFDPNYKQNVIKSEF